PPSPALFPYTTLFRSHRRLTPSSSAPAPVLVRAPALASFGHRHPRAAPPPLRDLWCVLPVAAGMVPALLPGVEHPLSQVRRPGRSEEHTSELQSRENL